MIPVSLTFFCFFCFSIFKTTCINLHYKNQNTMPCSWYEKRRVWPFGSRPKNPKRFRDLFKDFGDVENNAGRRAATLVKDGTLSQEAENQIKPKLSLSGSVCFSTDESRGWCVTDVMYKDALSVFDTRYESKTSLEDFFLKKPKHFIHQEWDIQIFFKLMSKHNIKNGEV